MEKEILRAEKRTVIGKQVGVLRRAGKLPAIMYGHHIHSTPISLNLRDATRVLNAATSSTIITIDLDGNENAVLVREKQRDYIRNVYKHIDFQVVSLTEKIRTTVGIEITGIAPAVKDFSGVILTGLTELEVESLPQYLPERITVDISNLMNIGEGLYVKDLPAIENVEILSQADEMLILVTRPVEEIEEEVVLEPTLEEPEVIERGKKEEDTEEEQK